VSDEKRYKLVVSSREAFMLLGIALRLDDEPELKARWMSLMRKMKAI
jgi:hypothetical protein